MKKATVELLAPAGNFACFHAAINAGANAIYLGGEKFGARAYADNFTTQEIIKAIQIAHIFGRKLYLTINTLVKENEFSDLIPYVTPFYKAGLDGVIVQDIGVLELFRHHFPHLELHASTQMTITGVYGASYMKQHGVCRVVPARELSLEEIRDIKKKTGLSIECFIHGSMCYAYSGQCLFSSILGGRSGNRGRCAGPCRLAYTDEKGHTVYPLSLKDMNTLDLLPELIEAGIDSFKIEGRMKSPEYVAGVTAVYRKYIDHYLNHDPHSYHVDPADQKLLQNLYIRTDICSGYYHQHHGKNMVTLKEPGYSGSTQTVLEQIRECYLSKNIRLAITGCVRVYSGEPARLTLTCDSASVTVEGDNATVALNRPLDKEELTKRLGKMGDTCFELCALKVDTDNTSFMSVKSLNELRRLACAKLEEALTFCNHAFLEQSADFDHMSIPTHHNGESVSYQPRNILCALASTVEQLETIHQFPDIETIYVNADIFLSSALQDTILTNARETHGSFLQKKRKKESKASAILLRDKNYFLVLPHIFRKRSYQYNLQYKDLLDSGYFQGVLVRNFEELEYLHEINYQGNIVSDYSIYAWNNMTLSVYAKEFDRITLPLELNKKELNLLYTNHALEFVVYGYIPLMYSANCIRNTLEKCSGQSDPYHLFDRYKNVFTVVPNCKHCYNILYNTVPLSLYGHMDNIAKKNYTIIRLDFSIEDAKQTHNVLAYYLNKHSLQPFESFTNGHYKRGVE